MGSFGNQGAGFYAGTNWGNPYGGRYYSPSGQLTGSTGVKASSPLDAVADLAFGAYSGGSDISGNTSSSSPGSVGSGLGLGGLAGSLAGTATGIGLGYAGAPSSVSSFASGLAGKAVGQESISAHDIASLALGSLAKGIAPGVFAGLPGMAIGTLSGLLGFNPFSALVDRLAREFSITDLMSDQARAGYVSDMLGVDMSDVGVGRGDVSTVPNSYDALNAPTRDAPEAPPGFDENDLGFGITDSSRDFGPDMSEQGDDEAAPGLDSAATAADGGFSDGGFSDGGFSDGQAGDPWKNGGLVQYSEWKKRRC